MSISLSIFADREHILCRMRKRSVANIMQQRTEPNQLLVALVAGVVIGELRYQHILRISPNGLVKKRCNMHDTQRVLESRVHRARVNVISPGKLADSSQTLECGLSDDIPLPVIESNEAVNRAPDFVRSVRGRHQTQ